ncbi:U-box domain-containing protein 19-like isoform X2 [Cynara cardunculus var. scolymus]|uniref:U-box domain-containing protein 19-like isoform X2 n=1 Tax=Cynara cardunculus var. scolymus TaxID=59895 RepID=UPI000D62ADE2|nr:U-box domain-containing protein 19-like isoform X2 [Cynara cardunculus var. scolymus]
MLKRFDQNGRRILKSPAVLPCQDVNPVTLLRSLITLSHSITSYQSGFFATQRRNSRESIRQIGILSMFFAEIIDRDVSDLPDSAVLCFSELHHSLQKMKFLLEDCTRRGARVWMLMKSHFVATQFLTLIRAIATVLDILPLNSIGISREIKELVEMVAKQAGKAKMEVNPDDEYAMKRVLLILNQFENRGVLFENTVLEHADDQSAGKTHLEILSCLNPEDFRCPISLELMTDPVTVSTGQTYDRASIEKWLKSGNLICPKTGEKLATTELVPNLNLRQVIQQYCIDHGVPISKFQKQSRDISSTILPGSPASAEAIKFLSEFVVRRLRNGTEIQKSRSAYEIRLLAKSNIFNRFCLIGAGAIPPLLTLLPSSDSTVQENAIAALLKLSKHSNGKKVIINHGGLNSIIEVLENGLKPECKQIAAATIFYLSSVQSNQKLIGEIPEAVPALIELIRTGTSCGKKNSLAALFGILLYPRNHEPALKSGIVPLLSNLIRSSDKPEIITDSLAVLATLAESFDGSDAILKASSLPLIIKTLQTSPSRATKEYCVSILLALCNNLGVEVIVVLANNTNLIGSLYTLSTNGSSQAGKKARLLIRIMQGYHETSSSGLMANWDSSSRIATIHSC